jgi:hypothetical protein
LTFDPATALVLGGLYLNVRAEAHYGSLVRSRVLAVHAVGIDGC